MTTMTKAVVPTIDQILAQAEKLVELRYALLDAHERGDPKARTVLDQLEAAIDPAAHGSAREARICHLAHHAIYCR